MDERRDKIHFLFQSNKPQERVLYPFYAACIVILLWLVCFAYLLIKHPFLFATEYKALILEKNLDNIRIILICVISSISIILVLLVYWASYISNKVLGPYERILKEMDEVISRKLSRKILVREGDTMFEALLKRVNVLIERKAD